MQNNWVMLQGLLCHTPNYASTRKGLHKVSFRLAVPRPTRSSAPTTAMPSADAESLGTAAELPSPNVKSDYVTVIIIGKPAWDFKQLDLQAGAAVRVEGRLRSWDFFPDQAESSLDLAAATEPSQDSRHDHHLEVIAEKVDPLDGISS
jgi:single-stranded DNA-binding protein